MTNAGSVNTAPAATRLPDQPGGTRDILFQDRALAKPQNGHADYRRRIRGRDSLAGAQTQVCVGGAQHDAHHQAEQHRSPGELSHLHAFGYEGLELRGRRHESLDLTLSLSAFPSTVFPVSFACTAFITTPICLMEVAPVSAMAAARAASTSSSLAPAGR